MNQNRLFPSPSTLQKEDKLEALLHTLPVGVSILGADRTPLYTNAALKTILKLSQEELGEKKYRKRKYFRADGSEMPPDEFPSARVFDEDEPIRDVEIGVLTESNEMIWTTVSAVPFHHNEWHVILTTTDTTRQKEYELALQHQTEALTERIKELNCLYGIADLVEQPNITLDEIFQGTATLIPSAWHYPAETSAQIIYKEHKFLSKDFKTSPWSQSQNIYTHGELSGSVEVFYTGKTNNSNTPSFLKEEHNLLYAIAERLGRITERFQAEQLLVELATTDPLTRLYNRRHYFELAEREVIRAKRYQRPLTCMMLDIDYFKEINDSYGHVFGDKVIQAMVKRCQQTIRQVDIFARYGGDEFIILLPEANLARGEQMAERLCTEFREQPLRVGEQEVFITLSVGTASMLGDEKLSLDTLLNRADEALYDSKKQGRNQVSIWDKDE